MRPRQASECYFCIKRGLRCTLDRSLSDRGSANPGGPSYDLIHECRDGSGFRVSQTLYIDLNLAYELVELYFRYIHVAFHSLFHQPSIETAVRTGTLPKVLLLSIAGLSARFSSNGLLAATASRERGRAYRKEAEKLINFHSTSLITIQACAIVAAALVVEGDPNTESVFLNVACRMALIMDLPHAPANTRIEEEVHLRGKTLIRDKVMLA